MQCWLWCSWRKRKSDYKQWLNISPPDNSEWSVSITSSSVALRCWLVSMASLDVSCISMSSPPNRGGETIMFSGCPSAAFVRSFRHILIIIIIIITAFISHLTNRKWYRHPPRRAALTRLTILYDDISWTALTISMKLTRNNCYSSLVILLDFGGQRSKVKVTAGCRGGEVIHVDARTWKSIFYIWWWWYVCFQFIFNGSDFYTMIVECQLFLSPYPITSPLPHLLLVLLVSFTFFFFPFLLALSIFLLFHPFPFYQNSPTSFPGRMS